jgi:hypothetical protein
MFGGRAVWTCRQIATFQRNILPPPPALKMETVCVSETLVSAYKSTRRGVTTQNIDVFTTVRIPNLTRPITSNRASSSHLQTCRENQKSHRAVGFVRCSSNGTCHVIRHWSPFGPSMALVPSCSVGPGGGDGENKEWQRKTEKKKRKRREESNGLKRKESEIVEERKSPPIRVHGGVLWHRGNFMCLSPHSVVQCIWIWATVLPTYETQCTAVASVWGHAERKFYLFTWTVRNRTINSCGEALHLASTSSSHRWDDLLTVRQLRGIENVFIYLWFL